MKDTTENQITKVMKIAIEISILLFAVGIAWATLRGTVKENSKDIEKHDTRIGHVEKEVSGVKSDIREIMNEQKHIGTGIKEIKERLPK